MKKIYILITIIFSSMAVWSQGIRFEQGTLEQALEKARAQKKMVFIDAYAIWCGPCKVMANTVFKDAEVGAYFDKNVVAVKIDVERGEGPRIKEKYSIQGLPGYVFMDGEGNVVYREQGSMPKDKFMEKVRKAAVYMQDPNSVGRLAARYPKEKNDEKFVALYLNKLNESRSVGNVDVLEHYLDIQTTIRPDSREMAELIDAHYQSLIYGGKADEIIRQYGKSEAWRQYVRKEVRERFQEFPKTMGERTTEYAIEKRDSSYIDLALRRAQEDGMMVAEGQRKRLMIYFYKNTQMGEPYKQLMTPEIEGFYHSIDRKQLAEQHLAARKKYASQPELRYRTNAMKASQQLCFLVADYAAFAETDAEKANVLKWAKLAYELTTDEADAVSFYANALYLYGDREQALKLKAEALKLTAGTKQEEGQQLDYQAMQEGQSIKL